MTNCDHITELSVYSPHTEYKGQWSKKVEFIGKGVNVGLNYAVKNCKYCPKCGKNIEPKVTKGDTA